MKVNTLQRYGLRAMLEVALHDQSGLFQKDIAHNQKISNRYLDHIVSRLKTAGLLKNKSGKKSGYILGKNPDEITILDIMNAFQTDVQVVDCVDNDFECDRRPGCVVGKFWMELNTSIKDFLSATTLNMLAKEQERINEKLK